MDDLRGYLVQIDDTLKNVLSGLGESVHDVKSVLSANGQKSEEYNDTMYSVAVKLKDEQKSKFEELRNNIIATADDITQNYETLIEQTEGEIRSDVTRDFVAKSELGEYKSEVGSSIGQLSDRIDLSVTAIEEVKAEFDDFSGDYQEFKQETSSNIALLPQSIESRVREQFVSKDDLSDTEFQALIESIVIQTPSSITDAFLERMELAEGRIEAQDEEFATYIEQTEAWIRRGLLDSGIYGIEIGRSDSNMKTRFLNDKISFYQGEVEVAYISDNNLYITRAEVLDYLRIGNSNDGYFIFDVSPNGLEVRWSE